MIFYLKSPSFQTPCAAIALRGWLFAITWTISVQALGQAIDGPGVIELPQAPAAVVTPPDRPVSRAMQQQMEKKRQAREQRDEKFKKPPKDPDKERNTKLLNDMIAERPNRFALFANLVYPLAQVTGPREDYIFEPSIILSAFYRLADFRMYSDYVLFAGARVANLTGTGTYDGTPGRFGFSYFGPMIGVGRIDPAPLSISREAMRPDVDPGKFLSSRHGTFFVAGVAGQSRFAKTFAGAETPKEDLNDEPAGFDPPGLWGEAHHAWIHFGAVTINFLAGVQLGSGKTILYFGGGVGGIY